MCDSIKVSYNSLKLSELQFLIELKNLFKDSEINYEHPFIQDGAKIIRKHFRISTSVESSQIVASLNYYSPEFSHDLLTIIITKLNNDIAVVDKINSEKSIDSFQA